MEIKGPCKISTLGTKDKLGYYHFGKRKDGEVLVHRWIYKKEVGTLNWDEEVRHLCHNPSCIESTHLAKGTHKENAMDSRKAGRYAHKLTWEQVKEIRIRYRKTEVSYRKLAKDFGVHSSTIHRVINHLDWKKYGD